MNSCCHLYAIWFALRGRVAEWVPTGASGGKDLVPLVVSRIVRTWIVVDLALLWPSLGLRMHEFGWRPYWATLGLAAVQLYMVMPLLTRGMGIRQREDKKPRVAANCHVMAGKQG